MSGLIVWRGTHTTDWLVFDKTNPDLFGRVFVIDLLESPSRSSAIPYNQPEDDGIYDDDDDYEPYVNIPFDSWISYLENYWNTSYKFDCYSTGVHEDGAIDEPVTFIFSQALPWARHPPYGVKDIYPQNT